MLKLTVRYDTAAELARFLHTVGVFVKKSKPDLSKPATKSPMQEHYRREIWLDYDLKK